MPSLEIALRPVIAKDLPILFAQQQDEEAVRMAAFPSRNLEQFMSHWSGILNDPSKTTRTILSGDVVIGYLGSWTNAGRRLVAYWIDRSYWGKGVATSALNLFLEVETTRPLYAYVAIHNIASIRVLEKSGFTILSEETHSEAGGDGVEELVLKLDAVRQPNGSA